MEEFHFSANGSASAEISVYNSVVTATASASASSSISLEDARQIATLLASNIATETANHDVNVINNTIGIVNNQFIQPLQKFQNSVISTSNLRTDQIIASLDAFKSAIQNVNYLANLVNIYQQEISAAGQYASVLSPIIAKQYYNNPSDFWITKIEPVWYSYFFNKFPFWNNKTFDEVLQYNSQNNLINYNNPLIANLNLTTEALSNLKQKYPNNNGYYLFSVVPWNNTLALKINYFCNDLLNPQSTISIGARIDLSPFIPNTNDLSSFSPEYLTFINYLADEIAILNGDNWVVDAIWPYANPTNFNKLTCLYSSQYPEWTGKLISQIAIPGSTLDIPNTIYGIILDLYYNYPNLVPGQIALITYNLSDRHYISLLKIDTYNGKLCFKQKSIEIESYFTSQLNITNDAIVNGSFNVKTYDGQDVIKTDNITKTTAFHTKIGVNQELSQVKGLIDIDNLSANTVINILNNFVNQLLYSYEVTIDIKNNINYGDAIANIPITYQNDVFIFKTPILNSIQEKDVHFLYVSNNGALSNKSFTSETFTRIQTIVNELNKMKPEYDLNSDTRAFMFSFVEIVNDINYSYLTSLRGIIKINPNDSSQREIFFIGSPLDITNYIINENYKQYTISLIDKFSSCCRLLNYSNLLCLDPNIQGNLLQGKSISNSTNPSSPFFTDRINNSPYFRERFGGKDLYVYAFEYLTNNQLITANTNLFLFSEPYTYFNNKTSNVLFKPNTDVCIFSTHQILLTQFNNLYGQDKTIGSFFLHYDGIQKGNKIAAVNLINIQGTLYLIGTGVNLTDVLDETIILKGDNKITGNLTILDDTTNIPVFNVDREKKQTYSLYHSGIGNTNPQTMLDINDCGIKDIINVVNKIASQYNLINYNLQGLINTLQQSESAAVEFIQNHLIDPITNQELIQDINDYLYLLEIPNDLSPSNTKFLFHWLYQNWNGKKINTLLQTDVNNQQALEFAKIGYVDLYNTNNFYDLSNLIDVFSWVAGIKVCLNKNIKINNNNYIIGIGVNLQQYLTYESNDNIQKFFQCLLSYNYQLQDLVIRYNNISSSNILNQQKASDVRYQYSQEFPIKQLFKYTIDFNNIDNVTISKLDYNTLMVSNTKSYPDVTDVNLRTKLLFLFTNLKNQFTSINENDYGVVAFEDKYNDFVSLFWCSNVSDNVITLISLELQINTIINPTLKLKGDMKIAGDIYFSSSTDADNTNTYAFIDTTHNFLGVNTLETVSNYANTYVTTTNGSFAKNNVYIKSSTYPNTIVERTAEQQSDPITGNYFRFKNFSTVSARRNSDLYTFDEMYKNSKKYTTNNNPGLINCYGTTGNIYHYGPDITYEIKDITGVVKEIGNTHIVIDNAVNNPDGSVTIRGGYGVSMVDPLPNGSSQEREILYVDNNSKLYVNSIMLGGKSLSVDESGNLLFDGKKVNLS